MRDRPIWGDFYTSSFRSFIRKIRVFHWALRLYGNFFRFLYWIDYCLQKPSTASLFVGSHQGIFIVESFAEFARMRAFGSEKKIISQFLKALRSGDTIYDIGASIGLYTILAAKAAGESGAVIAFEPEPQSRERLLQNLALNEINNVKVFDKGLGAEPGEGRLTVTGGSFVSGAHGFFYDVAGESTAIEIVPGDSFISQMGLPLPHGLKVDVEGFELEVLLGLRKTLTGMPRGVVLIEVHFSVLEKRGMGDAPKKIQELLRSAGFTKLEWVDYSHLLATK